MQKLFYLIQDEIEQFQFWLTVLWIKYIRFFNSEALVVIFMDYSYRQYFQHGGGFLWKWFGGIWAIIFGTILHRWIFHISPWTQLRVLFCIMEGITFWGGILKMYNLKSYLMDQISVQVVSYRKMIYATFADYINWYGIQYLFERYDNGEWWPWLIIMKKFTWRLCIWKVFLGSIINNITEWSFFIGGISSYIAILEREAIWR